MVEIQRRHDLFGEPRIRAVGDAHVVLFEHHVALGQYVLVLQHQAGHAIGLELHHAAELVLGDALVIAGVVRRGESVLVAADALHRCGKLAGRMLLRALEHQMLEKVGEARFAGRLVGRADLVPDHLRYHRGAVVGDHHDLHAVGQLEGGRRLRGDGLRAGARRGEERREQQGGDGDGPDGRSE
jgi:hypothetical protein